MTTRKSSPTNLTGREKPAPARGPRPSLSREKIASTAIRLADKEGLDAVTMQRVAREVGLTTMALYRYFPGKADVIALMIDSAADSSLNFGKPSSPWSARLKEWARRCLSIYRDHPWFLEATTARQTLMGPNELAWMEAALSMLAESGLAPKKRQYAFFTIIGHVRGHATFQQVTQQGARTDRAAKGRSGGWIRELAPTLQPEANRYPILQDVLSSETLGESVGNAFDFGLDCILDGIRARVSGARNATRL
jgi:AcrR family transcriptional regulator